MSEPRTEVSRRKFLAMGGSLAAAGTFGSLLDPWDALGRDALAEGSAQRPRRGAREGEPVHAGLAVPSLEQGARSRRPANQKGLRATGSRRTSTTPTTSTTISARAGVKDLHFESSRCGAGRRPSGRSTCSPARPPAGQDRVLHPVFRHDPVAGRHRAARLRRARQHARARLARREDRRLRRSADDRPAQLLHRAGLSGPQVRPARRAGLRDQYKRPYLNGLIPLLEKLEAAGAAGVVGVLDYPSDGADGSYFPYDGIIRSVPGLYVDRATGAALKDQARAGTPARLTLPADDQAGQDPQPDRLHPRRVEGARRAALPYRRQQRDRGQRPRRDRRDQPVPRPPPAPRAAADDHDPAHHRPLRRRQRLACLPHAPQGRPRQAHERRPHDRAPRPARVGRAPERADGPDRPLRTRRDLRARLESARRRLVRRAEEAKASPAGVLKPLNAGRPVTRTTRPGRERASTSSPAAASRRRTTSPARPIS